MSVWTALFDKSARSFEEAFGAADITTTAMKTAIQDWFGLYFEKEATKEEDPCQQIAYTIVRKLTKTTFGEYAASSDDEFVSTILKTLDEQKQEALDMALIGGECLLKPMPDVRGNTWRWSVVNRMNMMVFGTDEKGIPTDIGTAERTVTGGYYYTLLERRSVDAEGRLRIQNSLFRSKEEKQIGLRVNLGALEKYAELKEDYTFETPVGSIGLVRMKTPVANCVDGSRGGVSAYAAAVGLIHNINRNEAQLNQEFENGRSRVFVSDTLLKRKPDGSKAFEDSLFVGLDDDPEAVGVNIFSPELRTADFEARKQSYLRSCENIIGLKRGLLSEVEAADRTAKEITSSEGDYNLTVIDFQNMWTGAVKEAVRLCGILGGLYGIQGAHEAEDDAFSIDWGNGVLYDEDATWTDYKAMVAAGLLKPEIAIGWRFNMPTETEADLKAIREKYMPQLDALLMGE